jgi:2-polyprenyl-3-methyl-5-hydroxy-6-metoxy-1,4-benzoquinol methylase/spore coat polysaccharide biosynthesis predicted glycosyltransferase SpsG
MKKEEEHIRRIKKILFVPRIEKGKGGGHLIRCSAYVQELRDAKIEANIFISKENLESFMMKELSSLLTINSEWIISSHPEKYDWSFIILDNFQSSEDEYAYWKNIAPLIAIDEGGPQRDSFDFLIDILPKLSGGSKANISRPSFLALPKNRRQHFADSFDDTIPLKVLIVFGAEDARNMGLLLANTLASIDDAIIDVVCKKSFLNQTSSPQNINFIQPFSGLKETLHQYDLIVTHYGIAAFESIYARVPVLIVSPTTYHEKLAREVGFISLGTKNQALRRLQNEKEFSLFFKNNLLKTILSASKKIACEQGLDTESKSFIDLVKTIDCKVQQKCPVCGDLSLHHTVVARFEDRTYRRCKKCSVEYMLRINPPAIQYTEDYFFSDYKKQYGKTYLEDFPQLAEMAKSRLSHIKKILKKEKNDKTFRLLDIGCAFGPFLQAAKDEGFDVCGIDPSEDAVKYVTDKLKISAQQGFFPDIDLPSDILKDGFDVISLWYVIEHFKDVQSALKKISAWLKPGGILAFSTPSGMGISARRNRKDFLDKSPADHWTIWNPLKIKKILQPNRLTIQKIVITGHHPERFPFVHKRKGFLYNVVHCLSRRFGLGDTFEAYAKKSK